MSYCDRNLTRRVSVNGKDIMFGLNSTKARLEQHFLDLTGPDFSGSCCISSLERTTVSAASSAEPKTQLYWRKSLQKLVFANSQN